MTSNWSGTEKADAQVGKSAISSFKATDVGSFCKVHFDERERL